MSRNQSKDKTKLLTKLKRTPIVEVACKQAGIPRSTFYRWRKEDDIFAEEVEDAIEESSSLINDMAESQLINAIKQQNLAAITFWLKNHHRVYRNRVEINAEITSVKQALSPEQEELVSQALKLAGLIDNTGNGSGR